MFRKRQLLWLPKEESLYRILWGKNVTFHFIFDLNEHISDGFIQFSFICIAPNHQNSHLKSLNIVR